MSQVWMPGAEKLPIPISRQGRRRTKPKTLILHSGVMSPTKWKKGKKQTLRGFFSRSSLESHFFVTKFGQIEQYVPLDRTADANYMANRWAISVETEDGGDPNNQPWTESQLVALAKIAKFCNQEWGVPLRQTSSVWDSGINGHSSHGAPSLWTNARGKTCPGTIRKKQIPEVVKRASGVSIDSPAVTAPVRKPSPKGILGRGDQGENVKVLQKALNIFFGAGLVEDGDFGPGTEAALKTAQKKLNTSADGVYGPGTKAKLTEFKKWVWGAKLP